MPFRLANGRAYGPGALDMKAGLVIALFAVDALRAAAASPRRRFVFLWTSDEEIGSHTSRALIERQARRSAGVLVLEPGTGPRGKLKTARKGVGEFTIEVQGRAAHAGVNPQHGVNAVHELAFQIARISRFADPSRGITVNAGIIEGGTRANVISERARAQVDVRCSFAADGKRLEAQFRALRPILPGARLRVSGGMNRAPMERRVAAQLFAKAQALAMQMNLRLEESSTGGGSDGNFTAALGVPTLDGLGGVGAGAHTPDEYVVTRFLPQRAALLAELLSSL
jgi:glutamate carboxypeptidase